MNDDARVAFITNRRGTGPFSRKAHGLAVGFEKLEKPFDAVYLDERRGVLEQNGQVRHIGLGNVRARHSLNEIRKYLSFAKPKGVLVAPGHIAPFALLAGWLTGTSVVPWESTFNTLQSEWPYALRQLVHIQNVMYRRCDRVATISRDVEEWMIRTRRVNPSNSMRLVNPVDPRITNEGIAPNARSLCGETFKLVCVGRLAEDKGIDILLNALGRLNGELKEWHLDLIGQTTWKEEYWQRVIQEMCADAGIAEKVKVRGWQANAHRFIRDADVLVHPARWEPFGNVVLEALTLGTPVIATECPGGPKEILDYGKYGVLVPPNDPGELAAELLGLRNDRSRREELRRAGLKRAQQYAPERIAHYTYEMLVGQGGK